MTEPDQQSDDENSRDILHEGYLKKKGQIHRSWKKRYFILYSDKKLAYYTCKEVSHLPPINEINLSTVKELSLLPYSNIRPKNRSTSRAKSFAGMFILKKEKEKENDDDNISITASSNFDSSDEHEHENNIGTPENKSTGDTNCDVYVDAPINNRSICNKRNAFDIRTEKRSYWLHCLNVQQLNEWIIHLKYAIFGKLILNGYLTKKTKKKLKTKWKKRFIEVYQSKIIRIYKNNKKTKVKQQIDIDHNCVSVIKYGNKECMPYPIEIYDTNNNLIHVFSAENKQIRNEFMDAFYVTMDAFKINILCEGYLHFRADDVKYWKRSYFALTPFALLTLKNESLCAEFKHSIFSCDDYYNSAFHKYTYKSIPMIDPKIEKKSVDEIDNKFKYKYSATEQLLQSLKIFTVTTSVGKWYFGAAEATQLLFWCQSFMKVARVRNGSRVSAAAKNCLFSEGPGTKIQNLNYEEKEVEYVESKINFKKAQSAEPRLVMDVDEDLLAINDEESEDICDGKLNKLLSADILMAVNLGKSQSMRDVVNGVPAQPMLLKHSTGSRSLQLKPFTEQELMDDDMFVKYNLDSRDEEKNNDDTEHDYVYSSDDDGFDESDNDCLETTMFDDVEHKLRKPTLPTFIVDDDY